jgi:hypothetical protein
MSRPRVCFCVQQQQKRRFVVVHGCIVGHSRIILYIVCVCFSSNDRHISAQWSLCMIYESVCNLKSTKSNGTCNSYIRSLRLMRFFWPNAKQSLFLDIHSIIPKSKLQQNGVIWSAHFLLLRNSLRL